MKRFVFLTIGFEKPTPEIMEKWKAWFAELGGAIKEQGHMANGCEISDAGQKDLPMDLDATTGFMIVEAEDRDAALRMAAGNPWITAIRVYELMG